MSAAIWNITVEQGATWDVALTVRDDDDLVDLTGHTARLHIRETVDSPAPLHQLTSEPGGGITVDGPAGRLRLLIPAAVSSAWQWRHGVYDLETESADGTVTRLLQGEVRVSREVTR